LSRTVVDHFVGTVRALHASREDGWCGVKLTDALSPALVVVVVATQGFEVFEQEGVVQQTWGLHNDHVSDYIK
jgi:hypothetical protein